MVRGRGLVVVLVASALVTLGACSGSEGPVAPPATTRSPESALATERVVGPLSPEDAAALALMTERVKAYVNLHRTIDKSLPPLPGDATPAQTMERNAIFQTQMRQARTMARPGDIFVAEARPVITRLLNAAFDGPDGTQLKASIMDENAADPVALKLEVNARYPDDMPRASVPPQVLQTLPQLTEGLEYRFVGDWLILLDTRASLVADFIDNALPK